jgi:hypothetical protein
VKVYPNPSSLKINFDVTLPNNLIGFEFVVFDSNAKELIKESIQEENSKFTVDLTTYPNGVYYYKLISNTKLYQSGKFILTK